MNNSNIVILSTRWTEEDLESFDNTLKFLRKMGKKIIIFDNIYDINKSNIYFNKKNLTFVEKNYINNLFYYEQFLSVNKKETLTERDEKEISQKYYNNIQINRVLMSNTLAIKSKKNNLDYFNLNLGLCDNNKKTCKFKTNENSPIYYDETGHLTNQGSKYLFNKVSKQIISLIDQNVK